MNIKKYSWMAVLPLLLSACQDDALVGNVQQQGIYTLSGKMSAGSPLSRAQIELGNSDQSQEVAFWNEGDCISVYQEISESFKEYVFNISSDYKEATAEDKSTVLFTSSIPAHGGNSYVAVYPGKKETNGSSMTLGLEKALFFNAAMPNASIWKDYFKKNMYMMASGTFADEANASVEFKHLCAMARITYTNKTGAAQHINQFRLLGQTFNNRMTIDLVEGKVDSLYSDNQMVVSTNNLFIADGDSADVYMLFFPSAFGEGDLTVWAKDVDDKVKTVSMPVSAIADANPGATGFEAGKRYWFKVTDIGEELVWSKDYVEIPMITVKNRELSVALMDCLGPEKVTVNEDGYAVMAQTEADEVQRLELDYRSLTTLNGIEHFKNLTELSCSNNQLYALDVSALVNLTRLHCHNNRLTELDLSSCTSDRIDLRCGGQGSDEQPLTLTLKLTSAMKDYWYSSLANEHDNRRVVLAPGDDVYIPSLPKEDWE